MPEYLIADITLGRLKEFLNEIECPDEVTVRIGSLCCGCSMTDLIRVYLPESESDYLGIEFG